MLKIKIKAQPALEMPETILEAEDTLKLLEPYLAQANVKKYKTIYGRLRRAAMAIGVPVWGILRNKAYQSSAFLCDQMVQLGLAEWIIYNSDDFNPKNALNKKRSLNLGDRKKSEEFRKNLSENKKKFYANMSEERRLAFSQKMREVAIERIKKKAAEKAETKKEKAKKAAGKLPPSQEAIPDWFIMPKKA